MTLLHHHLMVGVGDGLGGILSVVAADAIAEHSTRAAAARTRRRVARLVMIPISNLFTAFALNHMRMVLSLLMLARGGPFVIEEMDNGLTVDA
jgi:hypothetical protein